MKLRSHSMRRSTPAAVLSAVEVVAALSGIVAAFAGIALAVAPSRTALLLMLPFAATIGLRQLLLRPKSLGAGEVSLDGELLSLDGEDGQHSCRLADIEWGARTDQLVELMCRSGRRLELEMASPADAIELLTMTNTAVDQRSLTLALRATVGPAVSGLVFLFPAGMLAIGLAVRLVTALSLVGALATAVQIGGFLLTPLIAWLAVKRLASPTVTIGIDGLTIKRVRRRFIRYQDIASMEHKLANPAAGVHATQIQLSLLDGETLALPIIGWSNREVLRFRQRIRDAKERDNAGSSSAFSRRGLGLAEWRARLRRAVSADPGFRSRRIRADEAEATLADPQASLEQRVGAAFALREAAPDDAPRRIRFAAEAAADDTTREVLLASLEAEEEAVAALEKLAESSPLRGPSAT